MNIVFDLGGVVFEWRPDVIASTAFEQPEVQGLVKREIFQHQDWISLDRGTLSLDEAIERGAKRTGMPNADIEKLFQLVPASLSPKEETINLIRRLDETSNTLYVLSNMHVASIDYLEKSNDIFGLFEGVVVSCRIHMVKPEPQIYEHLLDEHQLDPRDTVFIDDTDENLIAASEFGITTIRFQDSDQCEQELGQIVRF